MLQHSASYVAQSSWLSGSSLCLYLPLIFLFPSFCHGYRNLSQDILARLPVGQVEAIKSKRIFPGRDYLTWACIKQGTAVKQYVSSAAAPSLGKYGLKKKRLGCLSIRWMAGVSVWDSETVGRATHWLLWVESWRNELDSLLPQVSRAQWSTSPLGSTTSTHTCVHTHRGIERNTINVDFIWPCLHNTETNLETSRNFDCLKEYNTLFPYFYS